MSGFPGWTAEPAIVVPLAASGILYAIGVGRLWGRAAPGRGVRRLEVTAFAAGWATLVVALLSPLHELGDTLFSAHMAQHVLLMAVAAPLLVLGRPLIPMLWGLPVGLRRQAGKTARIEAVHRSWRVLTRPAIAWILHAAAIWIWHDPALYDRAVTSESVHALQHATFLATGLLFWWTLLHGRQARIRFGSSVLYLFGMAVQSTALGAALVFSAHPLYTVYPGSAAWGLTALQDQQLAGLIMWVPGGLPYLVAALALAAAWLRESDRGLRAPGRLMTTVAGLAAMILLASCDRESATRSAALLTGGNPDRGRQVIRAYGCGACHSIPGVRGAQAVVGPPLAGIATRSYIAGVLVNEPNNMIRWIRDPHGVDDKTAMPNLGVSERDARDIAGYLYTLR